MANPGRFNTIIGWILGVTAVSFVLLLAGFASSALTDDPPEVSPYASRDTAVTNNGSSDVFETGAYDGPAPTTDGGADAEQAAITIKGFAFGDPITVAVGQSVTISNDDGVAHTWTARDGAFDSGNIGGSGSFEFTFDEPGEFEFFCTIHPSMTGSIKVTG